MPSRSARSICLVGLALLADCSLFQGNRNTVHGGQGAAGGVRNYTDSDNVQDVATTRSDVFVATLRGVLRYPIAGGTATRLTRSEGLPDDRVVGISAAADGTVWAATAGGAARWANSRFEVAGPAQPDVGVVTAVLALEGGGALLGGAQGLARFDGSNWTLLSDRYQVMGFAMDQGRPLVATAQSGVLGIRGDFTGVDEYGTASGIPETLVRDVVPVGSGRFWALLQGPNGALLTYWDGTRFIGYTSDRVRSPWVGLVRHGEGAALVAQGGVYDISSRHGDELRPTSSGAAGAARRVEFQVQHIEAPPPPPPPPAPPPTRPGRGRGRPAGPAARPGAGAPAARPGAAAPATRGQRVLVDALALHERHTFDDAQRGAQAQPAAGARPAGARPATPPTGHGAAAHPATGHGATGAATTPPAATGSAATPGGSTATPAGSTATPGAAGTTAAAPARTPPPRPRNIPAYSPPIEPVQGGPTLEAPTFGLQRASDITATDDMTAAFSVGEQVFLARNGLGITRVAGGAAVDYRSHDLAMQHRSLSLATDGATNVWMVTEDGSAVRYNGNSFARVSLDADANVVPLMFWSRGTNSAAVARVGHNQLRLYRLDGNRWQQVTDRPIDTGGPGTVDVKFLSVDASGRYWVGIRVANEGQTHELGVAMIDNNLPAATQFNSHVAPTGAEQGAVPAPDDLTAIEFDASGTAWFAGLSGCTSITLPQTPGGSAVVHTYNEATGLRGDLVSDIAKGPGDRIFLATTDGLGVRTPQGFDFGIEGSTAAPRAIALAVDVNGSLWGAGPRGAWSYDGSHFRTIGRANGLASEAFTDVAVDGENRVWFVTEEGISILAQPRTGVIESSGTGN